MRFSERRALWQELGIRREEAPWGEVDEALLFMRLERHYAQPDRDKS